MMIVAREPLAKSESEITIANVATLLVSASRLVSGEVVPNFEAIVKQNEISFAQKHRDVSAVHALLISDGAVAPTLQKAAETIRTMRDFPEAIMVDSIAVVQIPTKPLPEGSLLRDTLRRLHYVQKVVETVAKWLNNMSKHDHLKDAILHTKIQQELIRTLKRVVIQVQQAAVIIGKYRDMGDIRVLHEMTLNAQAVLSELKEADESVSEKRKSIPLFKRAVEESKAAPKIVRQLASVTVGLVVVVVLSFAIIKLNALAPQVFSMPDSTSEAVSQPTVEQKIQTPLQGTRAQEKSLTQTPISETAVAKPKNIPAPIKTEPSIVKPIDLQRKAITSSTTKQVPSNTNAQSSPQPKSEVSVTETKAIPPTLNITNNSMGNAAEKTTEKSASPKTGEEEKETPQKESEQPLPKRKTIVIED